MYLYVQLKVVVSQPHEQLVGIRIKGLQHLYKWFGPLKLPTERRPEFYSIQENKFSPVNRVNRLTGQTLAAPGHTSTLVSQPLQRSHPRPACSGTSSPSVQLCVWWCRLRSFHALIVTFLLISTPDAASTRTPHHRKWVHTLYTANRWKSMKMLRVCVIKILDRSHTQLGRLAAPYSICFLFFFMQNFYSIYSFLEKGRLPECLIQHLFFARPFMYMYYVQLISGSQWHNVFSCKTMFCGWAHIPLTI